MRYVIILLTVYIIASCGGDEQETIRVESNETGVWHPKTGTTFEWILDGEIDVSAQSSESIDIDGFDASADLVANLHAKDIKVIGYISVGTWESWRPDIGDYPSDIVGNSYEEWDGEKWVDITSESIKPIIEARLDMLQAKGFDGIEPDNMDVYEAESGFSISQSDAVSFYLWLADQAHSRGLSIGQKNVPELTSQLVKTYDWVLSEDAFAQGWEEEVKAYITNGKAVFATEYTDELVDFSGACARAATLNYDLILKDRDLTSATQRCN